METNKEKAVQAIHYLQSLCNPLNNRIISLLEKEKELDVNNIVDKLKVIQPIISHYIIVMKNRGILVSRREGRRMFYSINPLLVENLLITITESFEIAQGKK